MNIEDENLLGLNSNECLTKVKNGSVYLTKRFNYRCQHCGLYIYVEGLNENIFKINSEKCEHIFIKCSLLDGD